MSKSKQKYPPGWDEERVRALAKHYETQTEEEQVAEHETARSEEHTSEPSHLRLSRMPSSA